MTELKVFRSASVYASEEDIKAFSGSIQSIEKWKGDVSYKDTNPNAEAKKLYDLYQAELNWKERIARIFDIWWPGIIGFSSIIVAIASIPVGVLATIEVTSK